jgi:hypothetical protein
MTSGIAPNEAKISEVIQPRGLSPSGHQDAKNDKAHGIVAGHNPVTLGQSRSWRAKAQPMATIQVKDHEWRFMTMRRRTAPRRPGRRSPELSVWHRRHRTGSTASTASGAARS